MNKFLKVIFLVFVGLVVSNCNNDEDELPPATPPRDFNDQYATDILAIESYLKNHSISVDSEFNPTFTKLTTSLSPSSIWGADETNPSSNILVRTVVLQDKEFKIYYLKFNQGAGQRPTSADVIYTSYKGSLLDDSVFQINNDPEFEFSLPTGGISGWEQIFPQFNSATISQNPNGGNTYSNYGAGVMFLPSGFGYFQQTLDKIPAYSPLIFSFKLNSVRRVDNDGDGILSINEDLNGDYYFDTINDDTDKDGIVDAGDRDDDNDNYLTSFEIKKPAGSTGSVNFLFNDIPSCDGLSTNPSRIKRHLDKNCYN